MGDSDSVSLLITVSNRSNRSHKVSGKLFESGDEILNFQLNVGPQESGSESVEDITVTHGIDPGDELRIKVELRDRSFDTFIDIESGTQNQTVAKINPGKTVRFY